MITVTWLGHATVALDIGGVRLLTDPLLRSHAGLLRRAVPAPRPRQYVGTDAVLISHLHHDHTEIASLRMLPHIPVLSGIEVAGWLRGRHIVARGLGPAWSNVASHMSRRRVQVRLVRADHSSRAMPHRPNGAHGFLIRSKDQVVWFAGDTSLYDDMQGLPELAGGSIDLALLPIHGWGPRLSEGHMGPQEAAQACALVRPRAVLPIHHGTFHPVGMNLVTLDWMRRPLEEFVTACTDVAPATEVLAVPVGRTLTVV